MTPYTTLLFSSIFAITFPMSDGLKRIVIRLLEPEMCLNCRFARIADVRTDLGTQRMISCTRLDCDNWDFSQSEAAIEHNILEED